MNSNKLIFLALAAMMSSSAYALDVGPFTVNGFVKAEVGRTSNICQDCQAVPGEDRQRPWADAIAPGKPFGTETGTVTLVQPYIGTRDFDLGRGFKVKGLYSQRWRDGKVDIPGFEYEKNVSLSHEDYGRLQVGAFPTRGWSVADYPYGTQIGVADAWASSGSGYGLLSRALRYSLPLQDFANGDLHLEVAIDKGDSPSKKYKPLFVEVYAQYVKGPWVVDLVLQDAKNGAPSSWSHGPFRGIAYTPADDLLVDANGGDDNRQKIFMAMARYQYNAKTVLFGGIRHNRWSGANATCTAFVAGIGCLWAPFFNVDGVDATAGNKGYGASSTDISLGATYRINEKWSTSAGLVHLGTANTTNPVERGQSNAMTLGALGLGYNIMPGLNVYAYAGMVQYREKGLAPMSMPGHSSFSGVDSRVAKSGNWAGLGMVYTW